MLHTQKNFGMVTMIKLLGLHEVAQLLEWDKRKVATYIKRKKFPTPTQIVRATPLWTEDQILNYKNKLKP